MSTSRDYAIYLGQRRLVRIFEVLGLDGNPDTGMASENRTILSVIPELEEGEHMEPGRLRHSESKLVLEWHSPTKQMIIPQSLYSRVRSLIPKRDETSTEEYASRVPFALHNPIPGNHGLPMAPLVDGGGKAFSAYVRGAEDPVLSDLVSRGVMTIQVEIRVRTTPALRVLDACNEWTLRLN